jgi:hypothetical protein
MGNGNLAANFFWTLAVDRKMPSTTVAATSSHASLAPHICWRTCSPLQLAVQICIPRALPLLHQFCPCHRGLNLQSKIPTTGSRPPMLRFDLLLRVTSTGLSPPCPVQRGHHWDERMMHQPDQVNDVFLVSNHRWVSQASRHPGME